jgi:hypothetical protein
VTLLVEGAKEVAAMVVFISARMSRAANSVTARIRQHCLVGGETLTGGL